jgi:hypothetical protein
MNLNLDFNRKRFERAVNYYGAKGISPENAMIRIESAMATGQTKFTFDIKKEGITGAEQNLKRNDLFVVTHLAVLTALQTTGKEGQAPLMSYPLIEGAAIPAGVAAFTTRDIEGIYNGGLSVKTGQVVNFEHLPLIYMKRVPCVQPAVVDVAGVAASNQQMPAFSLLDVAYPMTEELVFAGTQDHKIEINAPFASTASFATATANTSAKLVFVALGYKIPGATNEEYRTDDKNPYFGRL